MGREKIIFCKEVFSLVDSSIIHLLGSLTHRKKTSEANPIPESLLHTDILQENQNLKQTMAAMKEENINVCNICVCNICCNICTIYKIHNIM